MLENSIKIVFLRSKLIFKFLKIIGFGSSFTASLAVVVMLYQFYNLRDFIVFGLIWTFIHYILVYSYQNSLLWYLYYFYFVCFYFKLKLRRKNFILDFALNNLNLRFKIMDFLFRMNNIYIEINRVNNEFWMKFLLISSAFYLMFLSLFFYGSFLGGLPSIFTFSFPFFFFFNLSIFLTFICSTASMSSEADKTHLKMNKIFLLTQHKMQLELKLKVFA